MSGRYFFDNQTLNNYNLIDQDKHSYAIICYKVGYYSILLPIDNTDINLPATYRMFTLIQKSDKTQQITFTIDPNGHIYSYNIIGTNPDNVKVVITNNKNAYIPYESNKGENTEINNVPIVKKVNIPKDNTLVLYTGYKYNKTKSN